LTLVDAIRHVNSHISLASLARSSVIENPRVNAMITGVRLPEYISQLLADIEYSLSRSTIERLRSFTQESLTGMKELAN